MASPTAKARYPAQIVLLVSTEVNAAISTLAGEQGLSKAEVARSLLHAGLRAAGVTDISTTDTERIAS